METEASAWLAFGGFSLFFMGLSAAAEARGLARRLAFWSGWLVVFAFIAFIAFGSYLLSRLDVRL